MKTTKRGPGRPPKYKTDAERQVAKKVVGQSRRDRFKAIGKCNRCGKNAPRPGKVSCAACAEARRDPNAKRAVGRYCKQFADDDPRAYRQRENKRYREERRAAGLCVRCRNKPSQGFACCDGCLEKSRKSSAAQWASGKTKKIRCLQKKKWLPLRPRTSEEKG